MARVNYFERGIVNKHPLIMLLTVAFTGLVPAAAFARCGSAFCTIINRNLSVCLIGALRHNGLQFNYLHGAIQKN